MPLSNIFQCNHGLGGLKGALSRTEYPLNNAGPQFRKTVISYLNHSQERERIKGWGKGGMQMRLRKGSWKDKEVTGEQK